MTDTEPVMGATRRSRDGLLNGVEIRGPLHARYDEILTDEALDFVARLQRHFNDRRRQLLARRLEVQNDLDAGWRPDFLAETADVRAGNWRCAPLPPDLADRRVEITGPVDRKMIINALNSGAQVFMADFEDSSAPTWSNGLEGQLNLADANAGTIRFEHPTSGKVYALNDTIATLFVRPRGWHLDEKHVLVDGEPLSGSLFDFGLYAFHNARRRHEHGLGTYFYCPKLESHLEARLWNDVFVFAEDELSLPTGTLKATVLIETILAAFEMDEILHELRDHSAGLNCGRWDYIFSFIKRLRSDPACVLPDRSEVGMTQHFLHSYSRLLIKTCHRRGVHAMGGMAAQIPIKGDEAAGKAALDKVRADKLREVTDGHDGTWVAHPGLVGLAREIFDAHMPGANQIDKPCDVEITAADLLTVPSGPITAEGLRQNVNVGVLYLEAWLGGTGCVPLYNLMEDAATAEISRTQLWQWIRHGAALQDGRPVTRELVAEVLEEELSAIRAERGDGVPHLEKAAELFLAVATEDDCPEFLTLPAYDEITTFVD